MKACATLLLLLLLCATRATAFQRTDETFDFGWRFRLGATAKPKPPPAPLPPVGCAGQYAFQPAPMKQCTGLAPHSEAKNAASCEAYCCAQNGCGIWQWSNASSGGGCWFGVCDDTPFHSPSWTGGTRKPPVPAPGPSPPLGPDPPEARTDYDDNTTDWQTVTIPHDSLIGNAVNQELCPGGCSGRSYIPRYPSWYRKHFRLPEDWNDGSTIYLHFAGIFRETSLFLNGKNVSTHTSGYTSFVLRLDAAKNLHFGANQENVLAIYVDPNKGRSGWWYEGSGLYRHVRLIRTAALGVAPDGLFVYSNLSDISGKNAELTADAVVHASAEVRNLGSAATRGVAVRFTVFDAQGEAVGTGTSEASSVMPGDGSTVKMMASFKTRARVSLWQIQNPVLHTVRAEVLAGSVVHDAINTSFGFRSLRYDANNGMFLNQQHTKVRGFCDHNDFGSFGMAVPDRIKLFRAQASRSVGGNGRRTSHNAPDPVMLDIYDRLGVVVMDENRVLQNDTEHEMEMRALVGRDRNHPSVSIWSFCNEAGCEGAFNQQGGPRFQRATYELDGSRPTLANMFTFGDLLSNTIDVQGFSHQSREKLDECHAKLPHKPIYASECCSCNTMRDEDVSNGGQIQRSFNANCQQSQTNASNGVDYAIGTMVWTLFDYYGEPSYGGWPFVSSTFGAFDLTGFAKAESYWFRSQWLYSIPDSRSDKTFLTNSLPAGQSHMVHIVEHWDKIEPTKLGPSTNKTYFTACDGSVRQQFVFSGTADGSKPGTLKSHEGLCLNATCNLGQADCYPLPFVACGDSPPHPDLLLSRDPKHPGNLKTSQGACLDIYGGPTAPIGNRVGAYRCDHGANQNWKFETDGSIHSGVTAASAPHGTCLSTSPYNILPVQESIHVYSDAPFVELLVNGKSKGIQPVRSALLGGPSWAQWDAIPFVAGNISAIAHARGDHNSVQQTPLATTTVHTSGTPIKLQLTVDCPSPLTGTGSSLLLDGQDAGLVRAAIVDDAGTVVQSANHTVTFRVTSGPGRIVGVHSGNPQSHEPTTSNTHSAYHGLVRGAVMVTSRSSAALSPASVELLSFVDVHGQHNQQDVGTPIVIEASAPGLVSSTITINTSVDSAADSVLAAAERYGRSAVLGFN